MDCRSCESNLNIKILATNTKYHFYLVEAQSKGIVQFFGVFDCGKRCWDLCPFLATTTRGRVVFIVIAFITKIITFV